MNRKAVYRRILLIIFIVTSICTSKVFYNIVYNSIPDKIKVTPSCETSVSIDSLNSSIKIISGEIGNYSFDVNLLGFIPVKSVDVSVENQEYVYACGEPIGIYLQTDGVIVVGTSEIETVSGKMKCPAEYIVKEGDYITKINDIPVSSKMQLSYLINKYGKNGKIDLEIKRENENIDVKITPILADDNTYKLGIWIRDDAQGIGTLTYITQDGSFGALGHGISDVDTGGLLTSNNGLLYRAKIMGIKKSSIGTPGGLIGTIDYETSNILGKISKNTSKGIFGTISDDEFIGQFENELMPIGYKQDVYCGKAQIICSIDGTRKKYDIEILECDIAGRNIEKGLVIKITDDELKNMTNGIIQGMSGSPIIQDGKIIGAVTHVFVNDPTKGYGIFIENMLEH